jgi:hypothetical protein
MRIQQKVNVIVLLTFVLLSICIVIGCSLTPKPHGKVSNISKQEHPELINGEFDWGSEVGFDLTNEGDSGIIHVTVTLSCSEGQWDRTQDLLLEAGHSKHLTYFFQEPTINATNLQARVHVEP